MKRSELKQLVKEVIQESRKPVARKALVKESRKPVARKRKLVKESKDLNDFELELTYLGYREVGMLGDLLSIYSDNGDTTGTLSDPVYVRYDAANDQMILIDEDYNRVGLEDGKLVEIHDEDEYED